MHIPSIHTLIYPNNRTLARFINIRNSIYLSAETFEHRVARATPPCIKEVVNDHVVYVRLYTITFSMTNTSIAYM
jgi:hypothetical protein